MLMRKTLLFAMCIFAGAFSQPLLAKNTVLQTVDLTDMGLSTEGGEAKLYRMANPKNGKCRIEAVHYGEMGKAVYSFNFGGTLLYAALREYRYSEPLMMGPKAKMTLAREVTLQSDEGAATLPTEFETYKTYFDAAVLKQCL